MHLLIKPVISEKATSDSELRNVYVFLVNPKVNKVEIKNAVQSRYSVCVKNLRTMVYAPKAMRRNTKVGIVWGRSNKVKKALVELQSGESIDFYTNI